MPVMRGTSGSATDNNDLLKLYGNQMCMYIVDIPDQND